MVTEILGLDFMQRALMAVVAISLFAPILGLFLILRRQSLMSDTLSHVSLAGVAFGLALGVSTTWTTLLVVTVAAVILEYLRTVYKHYVEISTAILMSMGLALSLIVMSKVRTVSGIGLEQYLFGSLITISQEQIYFLFGMAVVVLGLTVVCLKPMYLLTFDEDTAFVDGLPVRAMSLAFNVLTGVAIALMIPAAGALLVSTIMVLPASIAIRLGKSFKAVIGLGIVIGFVGMVSGIFISYWADTPASATITMIFIMIFLLVNLFSRLKR